MPGRWGRNGIPGRAEGDPGRTGPCPVAGGRTTVAGRCPPGTGAAPGLPPTRGPAGLAPAGAPGRKAPGVPGRSPPGEIGLAAGVIGLVAAAGTRRTIGAPAPGFVRGEAGPTGVPGRQVAPAGATPGRRTAGTVFVEVGAMRGVAGFAPAGFAAVDLAPAGFAAVVPAPAGLAVVVLAPAGLAAVVFFFAVVRTAVVFFFAAIFVAGPGAAALARGVVLERAAVAFSPEEKAARRRDAWASSTVLRFVLASTPCFFSQAIASATGILSSLASSPTLDFAI